MRIETGPTAHPLTGSSRVKRGMAEMLKARVAELERENEVLRSTKSAESKLGDPGTKEKIDELVNEIDRGLALISA